MKSEVCDKNRFLLLYGSQTGQSQAIAEEIRDQASDYGFTADLHCLSEVDKKFMIENENLVVFIVSTTGDGEPPETALKFWKRIKKTTLENNYLSHLRYSLLGLGDTNYNNFANFGKSLDKQLKRLGAVSFSATAFADDAIGLEIVAEPWITQLWKDLKLAFKESRNRDEKKLITPLTTSKDSEEVKNIEENHFTNNDMVDSASNKTESRIKMDSSLKLNLPTLAKPFLQLKFTQTKDVILDNHLVKNCEFPSSESEVKRVPIVSAVKLTSEEALKTVLELTLDISDTDLKFEPGDSFGIVCQNDDEEIDALLDRLGVAEQADLCTDIQILSGENVKSNPSVPTHLPQMNTSIRHILRTCCDIRAAPKKVFLRMLAEYTSNPNENRRLQELSSRQGSDEYRTFIREPSLTFLDLLMHFPSCKPPILRVLEHLPRLQARPYSVANSQLASPNLIRFLFTIVEIPKANGRCCDRRGVCTGWLDKLSKSFQTSIHEDDQLLKIRQLSLSNFPEIHIFKRKSTGFHLPTDLNVPIIMIGAGAGIAPFIGFLEHRQKQLEEISAKISQWLMFGCRNKVHDFLYRDKITHFQTIGVLNKISVAFSRDSKEGRRYVQHEIEHEANDFISWIRNKEAVVYVCGDARNMAKDVCKQIKQSLITHQRKQIILSIRYLISLVTLVVPLPDLTESESSAFIQEMQTNKRYKEDIWM